MMWIPIAEVRTGKDLEISFAYADSGRQFWFRKVMIDQLFQHLAANPTTFVRIERDKQPEFSLWKNSQ
jgi:hypothetical protein